MGNFIQCAILRHYDPSLPNRGDNGKAKTIPVGGKTRAYVSSAAHKYALKQDMGIEEIRSAHLENLIDGTLTNHIKAGTLAPEKYDDVGTACCEFIGADWEKRDSKTGSTTREDNPEDVTVDENGIETDTTGRTVVCITYEELHAIIDAFIDYANEHPDEELVSRGKNGNGGNKKKSKKVNKEAIKKAKKALANIPMPKSKRLFSTMSTAEVGSTSSCVNTGGEFSLEAVKVFTNSFSANHIARVGDIGDDPMAMAYGEYLAAQKERKGSETRGTEELYSVTMYSHMEVDIKGYYDICHERENCPSDEELLEMAKLDISELMRKHPQTYKRAKQGSHSTKVAPGIYYIEVIENGTNCGIDFNKPIYYRDDIEHGGIMEQGIEVILRHTRNCFTEGAVTRYVMLGPEYIDYYGPRFEASGVHVIKNYDELDRIIKKAVEDLS